jgi:peptide/nickel transport system permease protein
VRYMVSRVCLAMPILLVVTLLVFLLMRVIPGDPALVLLAGTTGEGAFSTEDLTHLRRTLGTDRPLYVQYGTWVWGLLHGDLGTSWFSRTPMTQELGPRLLATIELACMAVVISVVLAVPLGTLSAVKQKSLLDYGARMVTGAGISIPIFVTGLVVVYLLVRLCNWFPPLGYTMVWEAPWTHLQQMIFPTLTLAFFELNFTARMIRAAMLEVLREDYIRTARAKGIVERRVILRHALHNAALPIVTVSAWSLTRLLGGTIIIEKIFLVPGMGTLLLTAITGRDYPLIQAIVLCYAVVVLTTNLVVDMLYLWLDPRIRYA